MKLYRNKIDGSFHQACQHKRKITGDTLWKMYIETEFVESVNDLKLIHSADMRELSIVSADGIRKVGLGISRRILACDALADALSAMLLAFDGCYDRDAADAYGMTEACNRARAVLANLRIA